MEYKSKDVQRLFDKSAETVRTWSEEFAEYLSPLATPGQGRHRVFSVDDLGVFALVAELKDKGLTYEDIHGSLKNGQRGDIPSVTMERALVLENALQLDHAQRQLARLEKERDEALVKVQTLHDENISLKTRIEVERDTTQKRIDTLAKDLEKTRSQVTDLSREIGYLKAKLEISESKD